MVSKRKLPKVVRIADYEQRSKDPDAVHPRDPCDSATIIVLPADKADPADDKPEPPKTA